MASNYDIINERKKYLQFHPQNEAKLRLSMRVFSPTIRRILVLLGFIPFLTGVVFANEVAHTGHVEETMLSHWMVLPFISLLMLIATGPIFFSHHWHHHYPKYAIGLGMITVSLYLFYLKNVEALLHVFHEYISFIALLSALFIASGGILIRINRLGTAKVNLVILFLGAVFSNLVGTTGASMLLIRPYMRLNKGRIKAYHIVFFIFVVSNIGGSLTPIGDPPLFLGFLRGVPFFWTIEHLWYIWLPTLFMILVVFYFFEKRNTTEIVSEINESKKLLEIVGFRNFIWLLLIICAVFIDPNVSSYVPELHVGSFHLPIGIREIVLFLICYLSLRFSSKDALSENEFSLEPIKEVAWLFIGIFATMIPALELIRQFAIQNAGELGISTFYWGTGSLSGILDNAPTYISFLTAAMGKGGLDINSVADVTAFSAHEMMIYLQAISISAVFFGAFTYIGNGPNFMVKAIAESEGVDCPSFGGYVAGYSIPILLPIYFIVWLIFYSGFLL